MLLVKAVFVAWANCLLTRVAHHSGLLTVPAQQSREAEQGLLYFVAHQTLSPVLRLEPAWQNSSAQSVLHKTSKGCESSSCFSVSGTDATLT